jgi:hypothetical protein
MNTTLKEKIESIKRTIHFETENLAKLKAQLSELEVSKEVGLLFLLSEYAKEKSDFMQKTIQVKDYMYILGGDGRSSRWDEKRNGLVLEITTKNIFITDDVLVLFKDAIISENKELKHIKINGQNFQIVTRF